MLLNEIICGECVSVMQQHIPDDSIDLTVTSPPYDNLRTYNGFVFDFDAIAKELYRVTKPGGVVVWVVGDETKNFCESLSSFKQAIHFVDVCGFNLLDTMVFEKKNRPPAYPNIRRYGDSFEYMFILSKGKPKTFNPIRVSVETSRVASAKSTYRQRDGSMKKKCNTSAGRETKPLFNVWRYAVGGNGSDHPAIFPEQLAHDHIISWSNPGDTILDPMCGSGTTCKMALATGRNFIGIDISDEYVQIARQRIAAFRNQPQQLQLV